MVDRPRPGQPDDDASREAALRMLVDALTGPGTPEELAREHAYLESFRALSASATARVAASRRRRRLRLAAAGGVAALAVTGTAAALTGTYPGARPDPSPGSLTASPTTSAHAGTTGPEPSSGRATTAPVAPTAGGGNGSTSTTASASASSSTSSSTSASARPTGSTRGTTTSTPTASAVPPNPKPSPKPTTTPTPTRSAEPGNLPPLPTLKAYCTQYLRGKVKVGSHKWEVLVLAAGSAAAVPGYCEDLVGGDDSQSDG